jgi:diguanylate cyclase (GGDEF)-like protein
MSWLHQLRTENDTLRRQTLTDPLTGLPNLRALYQAEELLAGADYPVGVIFADLDHFGAYNHHHGDTAGDTALSAVAGQLVGGLRDGDQVFRKGGEEFVALLPGATPAVTTQVGERLRAAVQAMALPHAANPPTGLLTVTVAAVTTSPGTSPAHARTAAADLVYGAKLADHRNQVHHP